MEPCHCISFSCAGKQQTRKTLRRHTIEDQRSVAGPKRIAAESGVIGEFDSIVDWSLYQTHWTATTKINESSDVSVLNMLFQISRDFVMSPGASKESVSRELSLLKKNFRKLLTN